MTTDRRLLGTALGIALLVGACSSSSASPAATASAAASEAASQPAATEMATQAPADTSAPAASMPAISLAPGAAGDLESMLPSTVGDMTFQKTSIDGSQIPGAGSPIDTSKVDPLLSKFGKTIADVRLAIATGTGAAGGLPAMVYALQIKGVPATEFAQAIGADSTGNTMTIGGKQVTGTSQGGMTTVYYPKDDIVFMVIAPDAIAQQVVAGLP